jgi:hypothetical protein
MSISIHINTTNYPCHPTVRPKENKETPSAVRQTNLEGFQKNSSKIKHLVTSFSITEIIPEKLENTEKKVFTESNQQQNSN